MAGSRLVFNERIHNENKPHLSRGVVDDRKRVGDARAVRGASCEQAGK